VIFRPNLGCLLFLLLLLAVGGGPLLIGLARLALFFAVFTMAAAAIGSWWLRRHAVRLYTSTQSESHNRYVETLVTLLVRLAQVDGPLDRREVTVIRLFFERDLGYEGERLLWVRDLIKDAQHSTQSVSELCQILVTEFDLQARLIAIEVLMRVAQADGAISPAENAFLNDVARQLGLGPFVRGFGQGRFGDAYGGFGGAAPRRDSTAEALATLGLEPGASAEQIKQAWRRLSMEHHPDRVAHLGEEFRRVAEARMRRINAAYDELKSAGMVS